MTKIDFYILADQDHSARMLFTCRLVERAWLKGHRVFIQLTDERDETQMDQLLWDYKPSSFIPHGPIKEAPLAPVAIGYGDECGDHFDVLINLSDKIPPFFSRFKRVCEIVVQDDHVLSNTREHFRFYQERGYPLTHQDMRDEDNRVGS